MVITKFVVKIDALELTYSAVCHKTARRKEYGVFIAESSPAGTKTAFLPDIATSAEEAKEKAAFFAKHTVTPSPAYEIYTDHFISP